MAYSPKNIAIYSAAFAGAVAGCGVGSAAIVDPTTADYAPIVAVAAAWAQAVDTAWGNVTIANSYDAGAIQECSVQYFESRPPFPAAAPFTTQANWTTTATAVVALVQQGDVNASTIQNITLPGSAGSNRAYGSGTATTAGQATITVIAAVKLIAKSSGIFRGYCTLSYAALAAGDQATMTAKVFTDAVAGTPLTLGNNGAIGFGANGVAQPGAVAVNNNGPFTANAGAGITIAGASAGYTLDTKVITEGTAAVGYEFVFESVFGVAAPGAGAESPFTLGTTCLSTISLTNTVAARATGNITLGLTEN